MKEFLHILEHSLIDALKILPILIAVYLLIELFEYKSSKKIEHSKYFSKKTAPIFSALIGSVPQCGFSVVATDLYTKRKINVGALIAVYIATSDEAIPILLSNFSSLKIVLPLLVVKITIAICIGFLSQFIFDKMFLVNTSLSIQTNKEKSKTKKAEKEHHAQEHQHNHLEEHLEHKEEKHLGCCNHDIEHKRYDWKHPLMHCVKIFVTILLINIVFGSIIEFGFKGEDNLSKFLSKNGVFWLQPLLAMLIGFIPNCASSVVLTELYLIDGLSFGALVAGLIVNAGLGLILLLKNNKNIKENLFIIITLSLTSLSFGYLLHALI